jgi:hypothetical protein
MRRMLPVLGLLALGACEVRQPLAVVGAHGEVLKGEVVATLSAGTFHASNGVLDCSGSYDPLALDRTITFAAFCSDGRHGIGTATRDPSMKAGAGSIHMDNGETATFVFGPKARRYQAAVGIPIPDPRAAAQAKIEQEQKRIGEEWRAREPQRQAEAKAREAKVKALVAAYWRCVFLNAVRLTGAPEAADAVGTAAVSLCLSDRAALGVVDFGLAEFLEENFRKRAVGVVVDLRTRSKTEPAPRVPDRSPQPGVPGFDI